uniref:Homeobox domain-containing protein n=1 Tax=Panagrolaimus davidi TaxID=227884 RepID=A0A914QPH1_9BILA
MGKKRRFTVAQLEALEAAFQQDAYLNEQTKLSLAKIGLNNVQIKNWFQNTRFKRRKSGSDSRLDFDLILGKPASEDKPTPSAKVEGDKSTLAPTEKEDKLTSDPKEDEDKSTSTPAAVEAEIPSVADQEV